MVMSFNFLIKNHPRETDFLLQLKSDLFMYAPSKSEVRPIRCMGWLFFFIYFQEAFCNCRNAISLYT